MNALVSNVLTQVFITLIAVSGIYVLTGLTGMFSLGQAAFMAIGSYVSGLLVIRAHVPFALAALLAVAGATLIGYVIGYPVVRLRRDYISLVTLGFGEAIAALLNRMTTLTGGASGLTGIPRLVGLPLAFVSAVLAIALAAFFKTSKYGRQCIALKGDELAAKAMGINVTRVKMIAFLLSVALTSYSGVLYAFYMSYVDPTGFGWKKSADWVIMVFFGGVNSLTGSTLGAFILSALPQALRHANVGRRGVRGADHRAARQAVRSAGRVGAYAPQYSTTFCQIGQKEHCQKGGVNHGTAGSQEHL